MKICVISNLYPPFIRGGAEIIAAMVTEGLKEAWQHVFVISSRPKNVKVVSNSLFRFDLDRISYDEVNEVAVYRFTPFNIYYYSDDFKYPAFIKLLWHFFDLFNIFSYFTIKRILQKEKPDVVITHNLMGLGFLIPKLLKNLKIKQVHTLHDVQLVTPSGLIMKGKENSFQHKFFKWIGYVKVMRWLMGSPEIVISPSKFLLNYYEQSKFFPLSKKVVLPNPIKGFIQKSNTPNYNLHLIYLGQVNQAKGVLELITSFKKIKLKDINLHIVGVGTELTKAKELAKEDKRIAFYGWLHQDRLVQLLNKADILVVPSLCYENSPTVIYESLSMGLPVLAADIGGVAELIQEGVNGWIFPAGDFKVLNNKIISLYQQRDKLRLMSDNCKLSIQDYTLDKYVDKLLTLIND